MKKTTKIFFTFLFVLTGLCMFSVCANAATSGHYTYEISNGAATITACDTSVYGDIEIPSTLGGYTVKNIGDRAFYNCISLKSISIPKTIINIGSQAFYNCSNLTKINITDITAWCNINFSDSTSNPLSEASPYSGIALKNEANLYLNDTLITELVIPAGTTTISNYAFYNYTNLTSITIPDSVTNIGIYSFYDCNNLASVTLGNGLNSVGNNAFYDCEKLDSVFISDIGSWCNIDFEDYSSNPLYYANTLYLNNEVVTTVIVPRETTSINDYAFNNCTCITNVVIHDDVTNIGQSSFSDCNNLSNVTLGNKIETIGNHAFSDCTSLTNISLPDEIVTIGSYAFYNCSGLKKVTFSGTISTIQDRAFYQCTGLKSIYITDIVDWCNIEFENFASNPLYYAKNLYINDLIATNLIIPNEVKSIKNFAFYNCINLVSVEIPNTITNIGQTAFKGCSNLKKVSISDLLSWCNITFGNDSSNPLCNGAELYIGSTLVTDVVIPQEVSNIKSYSFYGCRSVKTLKLHDNITYIFSSAFYNCTNLQEVYIKKGIKSVWSNAFYNCNSVSNIYYDGTVDEWDSISISSGNTCLTNKANITFGTVYSFVSNGGSEVESIIGEISSAPLTTRENYKFIGWYDNSELLGDAVSFPYSGEKTTLYAKWQPIVSTKTVCSTKTTEYSIYSVTPINVETGNIVIFASYNGNQMVYAEVRTYTGENSISFVMSNKKTYDTVKIFVWDNLLNIKPLGSCELVDEI